MAELRQLRDLGQSIWYDNIQRALLDEGDLQYLVDGGVTGVTSNPSIFERAIVGSSDYDEAMGELVIQGRSVEEMYEALVIEDIRRAADILRSVYDETGGRDGYVSLEVSPALAHDTAGTVSEARRLFATLDRPNVMIKVPATAAGIPAIETLIGDGININATLMFSLDHYDAVAGAYIAGLERLAAAGGDLSKVASVASFFVSRVDTAVDSALQAAGNEDLLGKIAIANAKVAYGRFQQTFSGERWQKLTEKEARVQRPLWASTGTKNPIYSDTLYVDSLIGPHTVNTVPPATLESFMDHGEVAPTLQERIEQAREQLAQLAELGIDLDAVTEELQEAGVVAFATAFDGLMSGISEKRQRLLQEWQRRHANLGEHEAAVGAVLERIVADRVIARIWAHDHTVWKPEPTEITNRLGWLRIAEKMLEQHHDLYEFADGVRADGFTSILLLGMGGSSLAPKVFSKVFGGQVAGMPTLYVLDSTDPGAVIAQAEQLDPTRTLFIVSTKSGGTEETLSFFRYFFTWTARSLGLADDESGSRDTVGRHFVAITDEGSKLDTLAEEFQFRDIFLNDPDIGGRYSALSYFGLVPAALVGADVETLLGQSLEMACNCGPTEGGACNCPIDGDNNGAWLGGVLAALAQQGRDKLTLIVSPQLGNFGDWVEQLIAESTGKEGTGILPVVDEPAGAPEVYGDDRLFVYLRLDGDDAYDEAVDTLADSGQPVVRFGLRDLYDLGEQFFLWEMATAVASSILGINPFDQPDVEAAKVLARQAVADYRMTGQPPGGEAEPVDSQALEAFLAQARPGDYIALQAYLQPTEETSAALQAMRSRIRDSLHLATTVGYGPRFLHSTGQLHKGDRGNGLFIQFTADDAADVAIPDSPGATQSSITFGVLKAAQAEGDRQALLAGGRRVIRFHLGDDVEGGLKRLTGGLA